MICRLLNISRQSFYNLLPCKSQNFSSHHQDDLGKRNQREANRIEAEASVENSERHSWTDEEGEKEEYKNHETETVTVAQATSEGVYGTRKSRHRETRS